MVRYRIAIIEDTDDLREVMAIIFECEGYEVDCFRHPSEFLMRGETYDLVISDWSFGHNELCFYINEFDRKRLMILTGSLIYRNIECLGVFSKITEFGNLMNAVKEFFN